MKLTARNLTKGYRKQTVVEDVSFDLPTGRILGVFGPNGAGKTTLLKILSLLFKPSAGSLLFDDVDVLQRPQDVRTKIGYVPQEIALFQDLSVADNLLCWSKGRKLTDDDPVFVEIAKALDIGHLLKKKVRRLSGGMKRRVNLAVALMNVPSLLILDEPLVGVDIIQRQLIIDYLKVLSQRGVTQVITSHYPGELVSLVDDVMLLDQGVIRLYEKNIELQKMCETQSMTLDKLLYQILQFQGEKI